MVSPHWHPERLAARLPFLAARGRLTAATRAHFTGLGYTEVETPALVPSPGAEVHLAAFETAFWPHGVSEGDRPGVGGADRPGVGEADRPSLGEAARPGAEDRPGHQAAGRGVHGGARRLFLRTDRKSVV